MDFIETNNKQNDKVDNTLYNIFNSKNKDNRGNNKKGQHNSQLFSRNNNTNNNQKNFISSGNMINISFINGVQKIQNYNRTYKFVNVEKELYENYPEFRDREPFFLVRGTKVKRFRILKENQIHNGDVIMLNTYNEDF